MASYRVIFSPEAEAELITLYRWIAERRDQRSRPISRERSSTIAKNSNPSRNPTRGKPQRRIAVLEQGHAFVPRSGIERERIQLLTFATRRIAVFDAAYRSGSGRAGVPQPKW
jgi:hypothetical protein